MVLSMYVSEKCKSINPKSLSQNSFQQFSLSRFPFTHVSADEQKSAKVDRRECLLPREAVSGGQHPVLINEGASTKVVPIRSEADLPGPFSGICIFAVNNSPGSWNSATG